MRDGSSPFIVAVLAFVLMVGAVWVWSRRCALEPVDGVGCFLLRLP